MCALRWHDVSQFIPLPRVSPGTVMVGCCRREWGGRREKKRGRKEGEGKEKREGKGVRGEGSEREKEAKKGRQQETS